MTKKLNEISIQFVKGVGPVKKRLFLNLGVETVEDLFYLFPRRYDDRRKITPISMVKLKEFQTVTGQVKVHSSRRSYYSKKRVSEVVIDDGTGRIFCVWFNQPYLDRYFKPGKQVVLYGKVEVYNNRLQMVSPEYEMLESEEDQSLNIGRIVPIYPLTRGMTQRYVRKVVWSALNNHREQLVDILPTHLRNKHRLYNIRRSIENIHFPEDEEKQQDAHRRVSFEEFFLFQIAVMKRRMSIVQKQGVEHKIDLDLVNQFCLSFPFALTGAQNRVIREIAGDLQKDSPMLRLLQGDVGSGKTLVALFGCAAAFKNGKQSAIMAPTEILARQHYENIKKMIERKSDLENEGLVGKGARGQEGNEAWVNKDGKAMRVELLIGALKKNEKERIHAALKSGEIDLIVGTHALLSEAVDFADLSYAVIDEQHKFGVRQRALLSNKGSNPDILVMTATPIPRTLSITLFGDLDVSVIDEMPKGRGKVRTRLFDQEQAPEVYSIVKKKVANGQQAYIIYPIIEESQTLDLKAAQVSYAHFQKHEFKGLRLGLVHGQMKKAQADEVMNAFKQGKIDVLVATTVLEVGVDVPNANVMVIEHAERFGLSQLHQLRGRIGRGKEDAWCLLVAGTQTEEGEARLKAVVKTTDGFKIAEQDLLIRGPGHYFGRHQHGLNELKFANPATQIDILELAREEAKDLVHEDPDLERGANPVLNEAIRQRYPDYLKMVEAG